MQLNSLPTGYRLHWYEIDRILGQGGFGITYLARDTNLEQVVAIKEYLPAEFAARNPEFQVAPISAKHEDQYRWGLKRFISEARTLARFDHPNIVRVYSVFELNNTAYMVMRYEEGDKLGDLLSHRKSLTESELKAIFFPILDGLEEVHKTGFIHRDIQPNNIYIRDDGSPVLLDFGSVGQTGGGSRTLTILVAPGYTPFEQYYDNRDQQGPWTDIYSLGATLYRAVAGVAPLDAIARSRGILGSTHDILVPAVEVGRGRYSHDFLAAIDHALMFNEKERPQSIAEWRQDFAAEAGEAPDRARASGAPPPVKGVGATPRPQPLAGTAQPREPSSTGRWLAAGALVAVALLSGVGTWFYLGREHAPADSADAVAVQTFRPTPSAAPEPAAKTPVDTGAQPAPAADAREKSAAQSAETLRARQARERAAQREAEIESLLQSASADLEQGRLDLPTESAALAKFRAVLALDPDRPEAVRGVAEVFRRLADRVDQLTAEGSTEEASAYLARAQAVDPGSPRLPGLEARIAAVRAEQALARVREEAAKRRAEEQEEERRRALIAGEERRRLEQERLDAEARRRAEAQARQPAPSAAGGQRKTARERRDVQLAEGLKAFENKEYAAAYERLAPLADAGEAAAASKAGVMRLYGLGVEADVPQAARWIRMAAENNLADAQYYLGVMYSLGKGVARSSEEAVRWYRRAAEQGHAPGQNNLGMMYAKGEGVQRNDEEAVGWYRKAAEQGDVDAQINVGHMYASGRGVAQNDFQAYAWFDLALTAGDESARYHRDRIKARLQPVELQHAEKLSATYATMFLKKR